MRDGQRTIECSHWAIVYKKEGTRVRFVCVLGEITREREVGGADLWHVSRGGRTDKATTALATTNTTASI